jgi:formylmethanofuran dehydrogenase subunit E
MDIEQLKIEADKLGYKLIEKTPQDYLRERNDVICIRCGVNQAVYVINGYNICSPCEKTVSLY